MKPRIMYIERGGGLGTISARIGRVAFSKTGRTLYYADCSFQSLGGHGYKTNYIELQTKEPYWISGPRKDGDDALYPLIVDIDEDVREEYWLTIRVQPKLVDQTSFRSHGKHSRRLPHPELAGSGRAPRRR